MQLNVFRISFLVLTVCTFPVYSSTVSSSTLYKNEILLCNDGESVQSIQKSIVKGQKGQDYMFTLNCAPMNACNQTCEWNKECSVRLYGNGVYVAGVNSLYYGPNKDRYLVLLCCKETGNDTAASCSNIETYSGHEYKTDYQKDKVWQEAFVNPSPYQGEPFLEVRTCAYNLSCAVPVGPLYSYEDIKYVGISALGGMAGLLLGGKDDCAAPYQAQGSGDLKCSCVYCNRSDRDQTPVASTFAACLAACKAFPTVNSFEFNFAEQGNCFCYSQATYCLAAYGSTTSTTTIYCDMISRATAG